MCDAGHGKKCPFYSKCNGETVGGEGFTEKGHDSICVFKIIPATLERMHSKRRITFTKKNFR